MTDHDPFEMDRRMKEILATVTKATVLSACADLVELGFSPRTAFVLVSEAITHSQRRGAE